jgi:hypothetical protein
MERGLWDDQKQDGLARYYKTSRRKETTGKKLKKKDHGNKKHIQDFKNLCKNETDARREIII